MQACIHSANLVAQSQACADLLTLSTGQAYFLAVAALLIASRFLAKLI